MKALSGVATSMPFTISQAAIILIVTIQQLSIFLLEERLHNPHETLDIHPFFRNEWGSLAKVKFWSISLFAHKQRRKGFEDDLQVEPQRPVFDVVNVQLHHLLE